ncbi:MAG: hypothetical protein WDW38_006647 [Sanguina aurantia]
MNTGQLACLEYIVRHRDPGDWQHEMDAQKFEFTDVAGLSYCITHGFSPSWQAVEFTARWGDIDCLGLLIKLGYVTGERHSGVWRYQQRVLAAMARWRSAVRIQRAWRFVLGGRTACKRRAVAVISDAYITWASRPVEGRWYTRAEASWDSRSPAVLGDVT